ncbi:MAG: hypothetical protein D6701_05725 [Gemmatimonadetes bacterium]|nr:MAG: hypothetical protein D6701_05725 [Gemmatimonadota bacterium]
MVHRRALLGVLLVGAGLLVATHLVLYWIHYHVGEVPWLVRQLFDLDEENNLPTWFSSFLLLLAAGFVHLTAESEPRDRGWWRVLAAGFVVLSLDEVAGLHETLNTAVSFNWALPGAVVALAAGVAFVPFLRRLERPTALLYLAAGALYVGGAVGVELLAADMDVDTFAYAGATAVEEGMEMFGAWLFLWATLARGAGRLRVEVAVD